MAPVAGTITSTAAANASYGEGATIQGVFAQPLFDPSTRRYSQINALTSITTTSLLIYFRPSAIELANGGVTGYNLALLFHEAVHGFGGFLGATSYFEADLKSAFGIAARASSSAITDYIKKKELFLRNTMHTNTLTYVILLVCASNGVCHSSTSCISGRVSDLFGEPLSGATAELWSRYSKLGSTWTDAAGGYRITDLTAGQYRLVFKFSGFFQEIFTVQLRTGRVSILTWGCSRATWPICRLSKWGVWSGMLRASLFGRFECRLSHI